MLNLRDIRVWNTGERIDLVVDSAPEDELLAGRSAVCRGDVDASDLTVSPGLADPHVHFRDPGQTDKESMASGAAAAASGGFTNVLIMPNTVPAADARRLARGDRPEGPYGEPAAPDWPKVLKAGGVLDYLDGYEKLYGVRLPVDYDLSVCASVGRAGAQPTTAADIQRCAGLGHPPVAITDDGSAIAPAILDEVLRTACDTGLPVLEHCEHHDAGVMNEGMTSRELNVPGISADTEVAIVERDIKAVRRTGVRMHFQHVSTSGAFDAIRRAKAEGLPITCETAPHYVALCDRDVMRYGAMAKMNPPLRSEQDRQATLAAVADGTIDMMATDHAPHTMEEKARGLVDVPNGIIGLETAYGVCHKVLVDSGLIDERRLIELMSLAPMRLMGHRATDIDALLDAYAVTGSGRRMLDLRQVNGRKGVNLTVLDNRATWTVRPELFRSKARNTPFASWRLTGLPMATVRGARLASSRIPENTLEGCAVMQ